MFPADTLFLVLLYPARSLSFCTMNLPNAVCHANTIPVSGHLFTYLATRLSLCQSLTLGLNMKLEHTFTAYRTLESKRIEK